MVTRQIVVRFSTGIRDFRLLRYLWTGSEANPARYSVGIMGSFHWRGGGGREVKAAGTYSWRLITLSTVNAKNKRNYNCTGLYALYAFMACEGTLPFLNLKHQNLGKNFYYFGPNQCHTYLKKIIKTQKIRTEYISSNLTEKLCNSLSWNVCHNTGDIVFTAGSKAHPVCGGLCRNPTVRG